MKRFDKILIANRGEIACRVMRTARRMGIRTVAVHSEADAMALHVRKADEAVCIGPAPSTQSYLNVDAILDACRRTGAEAVHPGYGFLSENERFAQRVVEEGMRFIGPPAMAIAAMGDKIASRRIAQRAGVPTIPGHDGNIETADEAVAIAARIGFPVMIKASAGGGGKGLRVARNERETADAFMSCRNESRASFGDDRVFIEKFIEQPRHVEIQVLGDAHGSIVWLGDRDCSVQRRHQKLIEEAPGDFIDEATRIRMGEVSVALAHAVGYQSAGTVEYVVGADRQFHFLEMNTRLQVEHPVTEMTTGLDLVEWMIRVAAGEPLGFTQQDIARNGCAIECRINAEDPFQAGAPSTGRITHIEWPATGPDLRIDSAVEAGDSISAHYDSMIAKLIVHAPDRASAIERIKGALDEVVIRGVETNTALHSAILSHDAFRSGRYSTGFIGEHFAKGLVGEGVPQREPLLPVVLAAFAARHVAASGLPPLDAPLGAPNHAPNHAPDTAVTVLAEDLKTLATLQWSARQPDGSWIVSTASGRRHVFSSEWQPGMDLMRGRFDDSGFAARITADPHLGPSAWVVAMGGARQRLIALRPDHAQWRSRLPVRQSPGADDALRSPMAGILLRWLVKAGEAVQAGQAVGTIEAMKMENTLTAERAGTVAELMVEPGSVLKPGQSLMRLS